MNLKLSFPIITFIICMAGKNVEAQYKVRPINELIADTSGWTVLKQSAKRAKNKVKILPVDHNKAIQALLQTQITTHSYMGAIIYFTGGILVDNGWIRLLGSGGNRLSRSLPAWNKGKTLKEYGDQSSYLLIGDDVVGGFFAINGGALGTDKGNIYYLAPETLEWESLDRGYSDFVEFCFNGDLNEFYKSFRWKGWEKEVSLLDGDKVFNFYPFLWTKEGKDIEKNSRKAISIEEQYNFNISTILSLKKK